MKIGFLRMKLAKMSFQGFCDCNFVTSNFIVSAEEKHCVFDIF
jgi:hypothetical protein